MANGSGKKLTPRERTRFRIRKRVTGTAERPRLSVYRSEKHMYAQLIDDVTGRTVASASTLDSELKTRLAEMPAASSGDDAGSSDTVTSPKGAPGDAGSSGRSGAKGTASSKSVDAARLVGRLVGERGKGASVEAVVFDRSGFEYTGRIRAVAEGAREAGLKF